MTEPTCTELANGVGREYREYRNGDGRLHRLDGPAVVWADGRQVWAMNGKLHRLDGPAVVDSPEGTQWWINGVRRLDIEATIEALEASVCTEQPDGTTEWRDSNGDLHRLDGPAYTTPNGHETWFNHGRYHRVDGPAITFPDGTQAWYQHGRLHRTDGPAVPHPDGNGYWWINGSHVFALEEALAEETNDD